MIGQKILHYNILEKLGAGGMGIVYKAFDTRLKRDVAIKLLSRSAASTPEDLERLKIEAQAAAALNHPNIATIHAIEESQDQLFIVMEHVVGRELREMIAKNPPEALSLRRVLDYAAQIAEGLQAAHKKGIVHRDIKSSNIMIAENDQIKIMDFGLAKIGSGSQLTRAGTTLGTLAYMSPEQIRGEEVDERTDIWSWGVVLYELLSGRSPFDAEVEQVICLNIINEEPEPITNLRTDVNEKVGNIIEKALHKDPAERYQGIQHALTDLHSAAESDGEKKALSSATKTGFAGPRYVGLIAALLALVMAAWLYFWQKRETPSADSLMGRHRLAVLPLVNMGPDEQDNYFADGMTEELISTLAKVGELGVIARTSVFKYKETEKSVAEIADELRVGSVLEGSIRKSENRLRISIQLVDTASETYLWSEEYDRDDQDVFVIQRDIAQSVADALKVQLLSTERQQVEKQATSSVEAHNLYLRGRYNLDPFAEDGFQKVMRARAYFERAIELDPEFALAYVGLADSYYYVSNVYMPPHEAMPKAREAAQKALDLDPKLGEAHAALATVLALYDWNWQAAEAAFGKAVAYNPNYANVHHLYGIHLVFQERYEEATQELDLAHQLDPLSVSIENTAVWPHLYKGDLAEAERRLKKIIEAEPIFSPAHLLLARTYFRQNKPSQAIQELEEAVRLSGSTNIDFVARLCQGYAKVGRREEALDILQDLQGRLSKGEHIPAYALASIYTALGDTEQAFEWLDKAYAERAEELPLVRIEGDFDSLRLDPRYKALVAKMGFD